jgi:hypothetical protein
MIGLSISLGLYLKQLPCRIASFENGSYNPFKIRDFELAVLTI